MAILHKQGFSFVTSVVSGLFFGAGMVVSGMVQPEKVLGFLDIFGEWDPSLAFVMFGALLVFAPVYHLLIKPRECALDGSPFRFEKQNSVDARLVCGAGIFGLGWGLAGFCPGPIIASLAGGNVLVFIFLISMLAGIGLAMGIERS